MSREEIFHLPCTDPQFLTRVFLHLLEISKEHPLSQWLDLPRETQLSFYFDLSSVQESFKFRALSRARLLSIALIDEKGEIRRDFLKQVISLFEKGGYLFYPSGTNDGLICEHILSVLRALDSDDTLKSLKRFQRPLCHAWAEKLIFETLGILPSGPPSDVQIRAAVLCACLTPLRQNIGSCFATAPAILIQRNQLSLLIDDLYQLLTTGKLKRTFGGIEYSVPLSPSTGIGDLKKDLTLSNKSGFCPGIIAALEVAEVIDPRLPFEQKGEAAGALIAQFSKVTAEDLIRFVLLQKFSLTAEDLEKQRSLEAAQFKSSKMHLRAPHSKNAAKLDKLAAFKEKEERCSSAFKGICDNALLKSWEFTIASFSEVKMEFSRWNLYSSLGFAPEEPGGIGELVHRRMGERIAEINEKLEVYQKQYEVAFDEVRATEALLRNASSQAEMRRLQAEYQSRSYHLRSCLEARDTLHAKGSNYSKLFVFLVRQYDEKFPEYFQEIYDAKMQDVQGDFYDDSPAGFRLVYKHGRSDPSLWTPIYDKDQYIDALLDFFSAVEPQIAANCEWKGGDAEILELSSAIIAHIRTPTFLETALQRMAKAHAAHFKSSDKKPWAYTSGGTMTTLLKTYYCRPGEFSAEEKWVESESELLIFLLDTLKNLPPKITDPYLKNPHKGMLMTAPTHAFVLLPGGEIFCKGWQDNLFTYTWVRDEIFLPSQHFYSQMQFTADEQTFLASALSRQLPPLLSQALDQGFLPKEGSATIVQWRQSILELLTAKAPSQKQVFADTLDAFLYQNLPVVQGKEWKVIARRILSDKMDEKVQQVLQRFPDSPAPFLTARELREAVKGCYLLAQKTLAFPFDVHSSIAKHARFVGAAQPTPLLFADTNWSGNYFAFLVNPGTTRFELWRVDKTLSAGMPMSTWRHWLNGTDRKTWSILSHPNEYQMAAPSPLSTRV